jgi:hypothetical protein
MPTAELEQPLIDRRALAVLGFTCGLLLAVSPDALLLPLVTEAAPRALVLTVTALLLCVGWSWISRRSSVSRRLVLLLGAASLAGGLFSAQWLPTAAEQLFASLADNPTLPGSLLISAACALVLAPAAVPLGALIGSGLVVTDRRSLAVFCLGLATGLSLAPHLAEIVLGRMGTLRVAALCAAAAASSLAESGTLRPGRHLARGAVAGLVHAVALTALCLHLAPQVIDLGAHTSTWLVAVLALGATAGLLMPAPRAISLVDGLALLGLPLLLGLSADVTALGAAGIGADFLTLALIGLPLGLFAGRALSLQGSGRGCHAWVLPAVATLPACVVLVVGLPLLGALPLLLLLGFSLALAAVSVAGRPPLLRLGGVLLVAGAVASLSPPSARSGLRPDEVRFSRQGVLARVTDPVDGTPRLAIDGRMASGRSALARRRLVHLPFLLRGHAARALLVASDLGQAAAAAVLHEPAALDWLRPVSAPWSAPALTSGDQHGPTPQESHGSERLHLARQEARYDLIVHLPDPRGRRRCHLTGTTEFFEENAAALQPGGLFCQWWDLSSLDATDLKGIVGGALAAFEHTYLMIDHPRSRYGAVGILGSASPLRVLPSAIDKALARRPAVAADWEAVGLDGLLTACLIGQHGGVLELLTPTERRLTDDRTILGVRSGLRALQQPDSTLFAMETVSQRRCNPMHWVSVPQAERSTTRAHVRDVLRGWQHLLGGAQAVVKELGHAAPAFDTEPPGRGPEAEAAGFVQALASLPDWPYLQQLVLDMASRLEQDGRTTDAEHYLREAVLLASDSPGLRFALAALVERKGDLQDACVLYGTVLAFDPNHGGARSARLRLDCEG